MEQIRWRLRELAEARRCRGVQPPPGPDAVQPLLVVSPHLDDAVLSCGGVLGAHPGSTVLTVMTAGPDRWGPPTEWDRSCGFRAGDDVMATRKGEDREALTLLRAAPVWLDVVEGQYSPPPDGPTMAAAVASTIERLGARVVLQPLGLVNDEHITIADALFETSLPGVDRYAYADLPYRYTEPELFERRLAELAAAGIGLEPAALPSDPDPRRKLAAIRRYRSQRRPLRVDLPLAVRPERYWRVQVG
ncbi:MAG: PIG-L family deacetylase [Acidobacteria bacterium]|nr:PIG-L family deacetylase [Acidobacteriota bacterium]